MMDRDEPPQSPPAAAPSPQGIAPSTQHNSGVKPTVFLLACTVCASLNSALLGYDIGVFGPAVELIKSDMQLNQARVGWAAGSMSFTGVIGALGSGLISDRFGRVWTMTTAAFLFMLGGIFMAAAPNFSCLLVGRLFTGLGVGTGLAIDPMYISEISPPAYRGALVSASEFAINVGILLGSLAGVAIGNTLENESTAWRLMLGLGAVVPMFIMALTCFFLPETPRWLVEKGRKSDAEKVMRRLLRDQNEVNLTMSDLSAALEEEHEAGDLSWAATLRTPSPGMRLMLIIVVGVAIAQPACGVEVVTVYSPIILNVQAGLSGNSSRLIFLGIAVWKTAMVAVAALLLDKTAGRRILLLTSAAGIGLAHLATAGGLYYSHVVISIMGLLGFVTFFSIGLGPVTWLFASEILPTNMRAKGMMIACSCNRITGGLYLVYYLQYADAGGGAARSGAGGFIALAAVTFVIYLFCYVLVPETKGKSLEEMQSFFEGIARSQSRLLNALCCCWPTTSGLPYRQRHLTGVEASENDISRLLEEAVAY